METSEALAAFAALSQATRLKIIRLLVRHEPDGLRVGEIATQLEQPQNTISTHLAILQRAKLLTSERHSRAVIYRAAVGQLAELMAFLLSECCTDRPDLASPILSGLHLCTMGAKPKS